MKIIYFVHDLADAAVQKRVQMLRLAGQDPTLLGFRRVTRPVTDVAGIAPINLGQTQDAKMRHRAVSIMAAAARLGGWKAKFTDSTIILARGLEMLLLARLAQRRFAPDAILVYESLDIHGMLVGRSVKARGMRLLERKLLQSCMGLVVSSHAFVEHHFSRYRSYLPPYFILENKVLSYEINNTQRTESGAISTRTEISPPWRIGWFGVIRCRRSLHLLSALARALPGQVEVDIRGRPARNIIPDFDDIVASTPGMYFHGAYDRRTDLPSIYANSHFTWAMDFYEEGANSNWLLPNRLYEGGTNGSVQIAAAGVETGKWLQRHRIGIVLEESIEESLINFFDTLTAQTYAREQECIRRLPRSCFIATQEDAERFVDWLARPVAQAHRIPA